MYSIDTYRDVAATARNPDWDSYRNCGAINTEIRDHINNTLEPVADLAIGELAAKPRRRYGDEHAWVFIPKEHVEENTDVIIDGALDQFNISNVDDGAVFVSLGPIEDFPQPVVVVARNNTYNNDFATGLFDHYIEQEREGPNQYLNAPSAAASTTD